MKLRIVGATCLSVLAITWLTGCSAITDKVAEKATENATEKIIEKATGAKSVDISKNGGSVKLKTDKGDVEIGASDGKIPDGFPSEFPVYDNAKVISSIKTTGNGKSGFNVVLQSSDEPSKVADFYKTALPKNGYVVASTIEMGDGNYSIGVKKGTEDVGAVTIAKADGKTSIMLSISK